MRVKIGKRGNSAVVQILVSVMKAAGIRINQAVDVSEQGGRIIIDPIEHPIYDLARLLSEMKPETFHDTVDFGAPVGGEL